MIIIWWWPWDTSFPHINMMSHFINCWLTYVQIILSWSVILSFPHPTLYRIIIASPTIDDCVRLLVVRQYPSQPHFNPTSFSRQSALIKKAQTHSDGNFAGEIRKKNFWLWFFEVPFGSDKTLHCASDFYFIETDNDWFSFSATDYPSLTFSSSSLSSNHLRQSLLRWSAVWEHYLFETFSLYDIDGH